MDDETPKYVKRKPRRRKIVHALEHGAAFDEALIRRCSLQLSAGLVDRLELAGSRFGINSLSRLVELSILHYLQACAINTANILAARGKASPIVQMQPDEKPTTN